jgi:hypothetical protein
MRLGTCGSTGCNCVSRPADLRREGLQREGREVDGLGRGRAGESWHVVNSLADQAAYLSKFASKLHCRNCVAIRQCDYLDTTGYVAD